MLAVSLLAIDGASAQSVKQSEKRVALVVGNAGYAQATRLTNPLNDATDMAASLTRVGFEVTVRTDLDSDNFHAVISAFARSADGADLAIFFYAGHAVQFEQVNYLLPIDIKVDSAYDLKRKAVQAHEVIEVMQRAARASIVFLDSCRNNTVLRELEQSLPEKSRGATGRGLARMDIRDGNTLVGFATAPNDVAADGTGRNSPYTAALLKNIERPGADVLEVLTSVAAEVRRTTDNRQRPEFLSKLVAPVRMAVAAAPVVAATPVARPASSDRAQEASLGWTAVANSCARGELEAFRARYDETFFGDLARRRLAEIDAGRICVVSAPAVVTPPPPPVATPAVAATPTPPVLDPATLIRSIQRELMRVGCDAGEIDGVWGGQTRTAAEAFKRLTKASFAIDAASVELLDSLKQRNARICPLQCSDGEIVKDGRCVRSAAPSATPRKQAPGQTSAAPPVTKPQGAADQCAVWSQCNAQLGQIHTSGGTEWAVRLSKCGPKPSGC